MNAPSPASPTEDLDPTGWSFTDAADVEWMPWGGAAGDARARVIGDAEGYTMVVVEAEPGYRGNAHVHDHPELLVVLDGSLRNQGRPMGPGDSYVAATGSSHTDFATDQGATYLIAFKL